MDKLHDREKLYHEEFDGALMFNLISKYSLSSKMNRCTLKRGQVLPPFLKGDNCSRREFPSY